MEGVGKVELVVYTGQFTRDERAGVDLLLVGNVNTMHCKILSPTEAKEGKRAALHSDEPAQILNIAYRLMIDSCPASLNPKAVVLDKQHLLDTDK